jgi:hypothetical protein
LRDGLATGSRHRLASDSRDGLRDGLATASRAAGSRILSRSELAAGFGSSRARARAKDLARSRARSRA